jgi:hypothetical protein
MPRSRTKHLGNSFARTKAMKIEFLDSGRSPTCQPNPIYPNGIDLDVANGQPWHCTARPPYPAPRCGAYLITCETCGIRVAVTVAGRQDDPRSVKMACKRKKSPGQAES